MRCRSYAFAFADAHAPADGRRRAAGGNRQPASDERDQ